MSRNILFPFFSLNTKKIDEKNSQILQYITMLLLNFKFEKKQLQTNFKCTSEFSMVGWMRIGERIGAVHDFNHGDEMVGQN